MSSQTPGPIEALASKHSVEEAQPRPTMSRSCLLFMSIWKASHWSPMLKATAVGSSRFEMKVRMTSTGTLLKEAAKSAAAIVFWPPASPRSPAAAAERPRSSSSGITKFTSISTVQMMPLAPLSMPSMRTAPKSVRCRSRSSSRIRFPRKPPRLMIRKGRTMPATCRTAASRPSEATSRGLSSLGDCLSSGWPASSSALLGSRSTSSRAQAETSTEMISATAKSSTPVCSSMNM
mmetsp:Transcript_88033/g.249410  ORF Transcript_88033/g.249410 Transcript_88033/m.249410 type:complete len:234 (+) Transcript_88033:219-920(+)